MIIRSVSLEHVRNHEQTELTCAPDLNVLSGRNGSGKTSVLEAISFCAIAKSFVPVPDQAVINHSQTSCTANITAMRDVGVPYSASVMIRSGIRKRISTAISSSCTPRDLIGELPVVALCPDHKSITFGGPSERRSFLDGVMAQSSKRYKELLFDHRRILKHRNAVLHAIAHGRTNERELDVWTEQFIVVSAEIVERRAAFLAEVTPHIQRAYDVISGKLEHIDVVYEPDTLEGADISANNAAEAYSLFALANHSREIARETTMFGPQKDELSLLINGGRVRETASQGQHKSLLIALKLAECELLHEQCNERPVVLLDDVFSELDEDRSARVLDEIVRMNMQCFITTTNGTDIVELIHKRHADRVQVGLFNVAHGKAIPQVPRMHASKEAA